MKIAILFLLVLSTQVIASDYPPGYVVETQCQVQEHVKVCAHNQSYGHPQITIEYMALIDAVNVWVSLNGRQGRFQLEGDSVHLNGLRNVQRCLISRPGPSKPLGQYAACPGNFGSNYPEHTQSLVWYSEPAKTEESYLFFYARNLSGVANDWDIEVAFVDQAGNWDSKLGRNYKFTFKAH